MVQLNLYTTSYRVLIICGILIISQARYTEPILARPLYGRKTIPGEFPFRISLQWGLPPFKPNLHFCGGAIINNRWILTHARCIKAIDQYKKLRPIVVKAGKYDISITEKLEQTSTINATYTYEYNDLVRGKMKQDVGLIKLNRLLSFNYRVSPIKLPEQDSIPMGSVTISGWAAITDKRLFPSYSTLLEASTVSTLEYEECQKNLGTISIANFCTEPFIDGARPCGGDVGGPITTTTENGENMLIGVVSWESVSCTRRESPFVFIGVSYFVNWINSVVAMET